MCIIVRTHGHRKVASRGCHIVRRIIHAVDLHVPRGNPRRSGRGRRPVRPGPEGRVAARRARVDVRHR